MGAPSLSIIIPAYNEAARIGETLEKLREYVNNTAQGTSAYDGPGGSCEILIVDDGSADNTGAVAQAFAGQELRFRVLRHMPNRGKGYSVRAGMLAASGELLLMTDADLSASIDELDRLLPWIDQGYDIVIASRDMPDSRLDPPQPLARRLAAWAFRALRRGLLLPELRDTQCGFKLFTRRAAQDIFRRTTVDGWLFDCEVLALAQRLGYSIKEVGIVWRHREDSRVRPWRTALGALPTLFAIRRRVQREVL